MNELEILELTKTMQLDFGPTYSGKVLLLAEAHTFSAGIDQLYCSLEADGSITLWGDKDFLGGPEDPSEDDWRDLRQELEVFRDITTPRQFALAYENLRQVDKEAWSLEGEVVSSLFQLHPRFATLLGKYCELAGSDGTDEEFCIGAQHFFLRSALDLPANYSGARQVFDQIYEYSFNYFCKEGSLPEGEHQVSEHVFKFSAEIFGENADWQEYRAERDLETEINSVTRICIWEKVVGKNSAQANSQKVREIKKFVRNYYLKNGAFPAGKFRIGGWSVTFPRSG